MGPSLPFSKTRPSYRVPFYLYHLIFFLACAFGVSHRLDVSSFPTAMRLPSDIANGPGSLGLDTDRSYVHNNLSISP